MNLTQPSAELPRQVGRYEIVLPIAKGGMGTVCLARTRGAGGFDRYVALKLAPPDSGLDHDLAGNLIEEAKVVAHLRHLNVVPTLDVGECEHGVYLVMEYVAGDSLHGLWRRARKMSKPVPKGVSLRIIIDALRGLHAAHEHIDEEGKPQRLVHRDFSPQNVLVGTDGVGRLTDFGIAKTLSRASHTRSGFVKGKLRYLAPEQVRGLPLDRRCDIWAAGVVLWELFTGRQLYRARDLALLVQASISDPPRVRTIAPDVPAKLDEVIASALRVDRELRVPNALQFARTLMAAAKSANMLAEHDEVAAAVEEFVGPELARRRDAVQTAKDEDAEETVTTIAVDIAVVEEESDAEGSEPLDEATEKAIHAIFEADVASPAPNDDAVEATLRTETVPIHEPEGRAKRVLPLGCVLVAIFMGVAASIVIVAGYMLWLRR